MFESAEQTLADLAARVAVLEAAAGVVVEPPVVDPPSDPPAGTLTLTALSADHAPIGAQVTLTGAGFGASGAVWFGHRPMHTFADGVVARPVTKQAEIVSWSDTEIVALVPSMSPGLADAPSTHHPVYVEVGGQVSNAVAFWIPPATIIDATTLPSVVAATFPNSARAVEVHTYANSAGSRHDSYTTHLTLSTASQYGNYIARGSHDVLIEGVTFVCDSTATYFNDTGVLTMGGYAPGQSPDNIYNITFHNCVIANNTSMDNGEGVNGVKVYHGNDANRFGDWTFADCSFGTPNSPGGAFSRASIEIVEPTGGLSYNLTDQNYLQNINIVGCDFEPCGWICGLSFAVYGRGPDRNTLIDSCTFKGNAGASAWDRINGWEFSGKGIVARDCDLWGGMQQWFNLEGNCTNIGGLDMSGQNVHRYFKNLTCDFTHRYGSAAANGWIFACSEDGSDYQVWDDCDFNFGDGSNQLVGWNYQNIESTCHHTDWSTSYFHGQTQFGSPSSIYGYFRDWSLQESGVGAAYADNGFIWPQLGSRP